MLLSLLPLAGWAQMADFPAAATISGLSTYTYTGGDQKATIIAAAKVMNSSDNLTSGATIKIYTDEDCTSEASEVKDAGTYYVGAYGNGVDYKATSLVSKEFEVGQKEITVTANTTTVKYGNLIEDEDFTVAYSWTGGGDNWATGSTGTATVQDNTVTGNITFTSNYVAGSTAVGASSIVITPVVTGLSAKNFKFVAASGAVTVQARDLNAEFVTLSKTTSVYNAANQRPTFTVKENGEDIAASNYTAVWKNPSDAPIDVANYDDTDKFKTVGTYTLTITGIGNYTTGETPIIKTFEITKKDLYIKTRSITQTYNGVTVTPAANATYLKFQGLEGTDAEVYDELTVTLGTVSGLTAGFDAGTYPINVTKAADFATNNSLAANYNVEVGSVGSLTIDKKAITITANNASKKWDNDASSDGYTAGKLATACTTASTTAGTAKLSEDLVSGDAFTTLPKLKRNAGETATTYNLTPSAAVIKRSGTDVTKNYQITYTAGVFTITPAGFTIWADDKTSVYGQNIVALTATVVGIPAADAAKIKYNSGAITTTATSSSDRGTYTITIDKSKIDFSEIASLYDIEGVAVVPGEYEITPAALKIKAADQSLQVGAQVTAASASNIEFVTEGVSDDDKAEVIANITLAFATTPAVPTSGSPMTLAADAATGGFDGENATTDGIWVGGITIDATAYNALTTANYTLNKTVATGAEAAAGKLIVTAADAALDLDAETDDDAIVTGLTANDGKRVTVTVKNRDIEANMWTVMVLPFATTAREISGKLGYAVVNVLNKEKGNGSDVYFKLTMGEIPANTPFIVKTDVKHTGDIVFAGKVIEKSAQLTNNTNVDAGGSIYYGVYQNYTINGSEQLFLSTKTDGKWGFQNKNNTIVPTKAFIQLPAAPAPGGEARVFIEEADGTVTAINVVNADVKNENAEGWYNINGVRMQSVPSVKGLYIHNGKKVIIK